MGSERIVYSALQTPDGTIIESRHRHDYNVHEDKNGKRYMIDGGLDYIRSSANGDEKYITLTLDSPHEVVREYVTWGTYGIDGNQPLKFKPVSTLDTDHIEAILETQRYMNPNIKQVMINELEYRNAK
jgi:hypothetical protein